MSWIISATMTKSWTLSSRTTSRSVGRLTSKSQANLITHRNQMGKRRLLSLHLVKRRNLLWLSWRKARNTMQRLRASIRKRWILWIRWSILSFNSLIRNQELFNQNQSKRKRHLWLKDPWSTCKLGMTWRSSLKVLFGNDTLDWIEAKGLVNYALENLARLLWSGKPHFLVFYKEASSMGRSRG